MIYCGHRASVQKLATKVHYGSMPLFPPPRTTELRVTNLHLWGIHGVHAEEKKQPQEFIVSISATATLPTDLNDSIDTTIDYGSFVRVAKQIVETESHNLVETLTEHIAAQTLADSRIISVTVTVDKVAPFAPALVGITITRP